MWIQNLLEFCSRVNRVLGLDWAWRFAGDYLFAREARYRAPNATFNSAAFRLQRQKAPVIHFPKARLLPAMIFGSLVVSLSACGGGGSGTPSVTAGDASPGGIWSGVIKVSPGFYPDGDPLPYEKLNFQGIAAEDGSYQFYSFVSASNGNILLLGHTSGEFQTAGSWISGEGISEFRSSRRSGGGVTAAAVESSSITGTIVERRRIKGEIYSEHGYSYGMSGPLSLNFDPAYFLDSSLEAIAGTYVVNTFFLSIDETGRIFGQYADFGCVVDGTVSIINPEYNAYRMEFVYSNCTGDASYVNGLDFSGLAYIDPSMGTNGGIRYLMVAPFQDGYADLKGDLERQ